MSISVDGRAPVCRLLWRRSFCEEIRALKEVLKRIEALLEERLIGVEDPLPDEARAIEEYEADKERSRAVLVKLEDVLRGSETR